MDFDQMDFDGLDANFDALNANDEELEGLGQKLEALVMNIFLCLGRFFFYFIWQQEHFWIHSLDTPSLEIGELQAIV